MFKYHGSGNLQAKNRFRDYFFEKKLGVDGYKRAIDFNLCLVG